jgi:hypothetical protein
MQCTTSLTPTALLAQLREHISTVQVISDKGKVVNKDGRPATEVRYDRDSIQVVSDDELRINITWENQFGYTVYTMTCNMRARDPCPKTVKDRNGKDVIEKFFSMAGYNTVVPDVGSVIQTVTDCRDRIQKEVDRLKEEARASGKLRPAPKKFVPRAQLPRK